MLVNMNFDYQRYFTRKRLDSKFATRKWNIGNDNSKVNYYVGNEIIPKIDGTRIDDAEDIVMSIYNLKEYTSNY